MVLEETELHRRLQSFANKALFKMGLIHKEYFDKAKAIANETYISIVIRKVDEEIAMQNFKDQLSNI